MSLRGFRASITNVPRGVVPVATFTTRNELALTLNGSTGFENRTAISWFWDVLTMEQNTWLPPCPLEHPSEHVSTNMFPPSEPASLPSWEQAVSDRARRRRRRAGALELFLMINWGGLEEAPRIACVPGTPVRDWGGEEASGDRG